MEEAGAAAAEAVRVVGIEEVAHFINDNLLRFKLSFSNKAFFFIFSFLLRAAVVSIPS